MLSEREISLTGLAILSFACIDSLYRSLVKGSRTPDLTGIVDDSRRLVEHLFMADQRPTAEFDDRLGYAIHANGITRPI
jgi:hypothetical protein